MRPKHPNDRRRAAEAGFIGTFPFGRGAWRGIKEWRTLAERRERARVRDELLTVDQFDPDAATPDPARHRHSARWDLY